MTSSDASLIVTVTTVDGAITIHKYPVPSDNNLLSQLIDEIFAQVDQAVTNGKGGVVFHIPRQLIG